MTGFLEALVKKLAPWEWLFMLSLGFLGGGSMAAIHYKAEIAGIYLTHIRLQNAAQEAITAALQNAREADEEGQRLAQAQLVLESQNRKLTQEINDALRKLTQNRPCLDAPVVGLLNGASASARGGLSAPASGVIGPVAAFASDTDVAVWANYAREHYELCRGRIETLNTFYNKMDIKEETP